MNPLHLILQILLAFSLSNTTFAWGNLGHRTIAYLAEKYISREGRIYLNNVLGPVDLGEAAIWADVYKTTAKGKSTASWHYINGHDNPPQSCDLDFGRDCAGEEGCVVTAVLNLTRSLRNRHTSPLAKLEGMKLLLHLMGDLHMPLHTENLARGGLDIPVLFDEKETNLHSAWSINIPQKITSSNGTTEVLAARTWAEKLHIWTSNQAFAEDFWATGEELFSESELGDGNQKQRLELVKRIESNIRIVAWARETNRWVCNYVLKDGGEGVEGKELGGDYYDGAVLVVEGLIARAGRRLGGLINALAEEHGPW